MKNQATFSAYNAAVIATTLQAILSSHNIPLSGTISPKTGKEVTAFGHVKRSTQGVIDNLLIFGKEKSFSRLFFVAAKHEDSLKGSDSAMLAALERGATLRGHCSKHSLEKVCGKINHLGNHRDVFRKCFLASFPGREKAWQEIDQYLANLVPISKAMYKQLAAKCETLRHCTVLFEVQVGLEDTENRFKKSQEIELAYVAKDKEKNLEVEIAWKNHRAQIE